MIVSSLSTAASRSSKTFADFLARRPHEVYQDFVFVFTDTTRTKVLMVIDLASDKILLTNKRPSAIKAE